MSDTIGRFYLLASCAVLALAASLFGAPPYQQWPMPRNTPVIELGRRGMNPPSEFAFYYNYYATQLPWYNVDTTGIPYRQDIVLVSATSTPSYPLQGPHMIELYPGGRTAYYTQFLQELRTIVTTWIPQADYDGMLVMDYEYFSPNWTGHRNTPSTQARDAIDEDYLDDWRETLRETRAGVLAGMNPAQQEAYFKQEWLATTREFFERAYSEVKSLRPRAKVTFYNQPTQTYWPWRDAAQAAAIRTGNTDEAGWFYQMVDIVCPSVYPLFQAVPDGQPVGQHQDHESDFDAYLRANIAEAIRLANGKPVYPYITLQYHPSMGNLAWHATNTYNTRRPVEIARELGCNGVVLCLWIQDQQQYNEVSSLIQNTFAPLARQYASMPALAPANPAPVGGAGGGAPSGSGSGTGTGTGSGTTAGGTTGGTGSGTTGGGGGGGGGTSTGGGSTGSGSASGGSGVGSVTGGSGSGSTGSGVVSVGGGGSSGGSSGSSGSTGGTDTASGGGGSSSGGSSAAAPASAAVASGGGGSGGGGSGGAGSGGTALTGGAASGSNATGVVTSFRNDGTGAAGSAPTTNSLAGVSMMMAAGPVPMGDAGTAVVPGIDLQNADIRVAGADLASLDQALARASGYVGSADQSSNLDGARFVRPGMDETPAIAAAQTSELGHVVRPGPDGAAFNTTIALIPAPTLTAQAPFRIVRPGGATGTGAGQAIFSTAQMAQGGRFVRPGQGVDTRPAAPSAPAAPATAITTVPTPQ